MQLLFKQKLFSWFDSYDVYDENQNTVFTVQGKMAWGHCLEISNGYNGYVGKIKEEMLTFPPRFAMYIGNNYIGEIKKELSFFKPVFTLNCNDWRVTGDIFGLDYQVIDSRGNMIMQAQKQLFNWTDTYVIDIVRQEDSLLSLMIVLAIDAIKCSNN